jgi:hypothetical protein
MSLNMGDQEYNSGKKYRQKGTLCDPNRSKEPYNPYPTTLKRTYNILTLIHTILGVEDD